MKHAVLLPLLLSLLLLTACEPTARDSDTSAPARRFRVLFDTDANNELDDQHALAYLLLNGATFDVQAVTVNATYNGGEIEEHYLEAERVMKLCNAEGQVPLYRGANGAFEEIRPTVDQDSFDGHEAVRAILNQIRSADSPLVLLAVGKLTNVALAHVIDPEIGDNVRLVWLGSNYPEPGEYNQDNDTAALNYLLNTDIPFEMVTVRGGKPTGSYAVKVTPEEVRANMPGLGPQAAAPVTGRHGGEFDRFGDYSVNLFEHADFYGDPPGRSMFDMVAVAVVKNPAWGKRREIPAPILLNNRWQERPENPRRITVWEQFDRDGIIGDFYRCLREPVVAQPAL